MKKNFIGGAQFPRGVTFGERYEAINRVLLGKPANCLAFSRGVI